jgi:hypothetical protein
MDELEGLRDFLEPMVYDAAFVLMTTLDIAKEDITLIIWAALPTRFCLEWIGSGLTCIIAADSAKKKPSFIIFRECRKKGSNYRVQHHPTTTAFAAIFIQKEKTLALKEKFPTLSGTC